VVKKTRKGQGAALAEGAEARRTKAAKAALLQYRFGKQLKALQNRIIRSDPSALFTK